jgi:hypothetical protein
MSYFDGILIGEDLPRSLVAHEQGHEFGMILADLVLQGLPITEVLTEIVGQGPLNFNEALVTARLLHNRRAV